MTLSSKSFFDHSSSHPPFVTYRSTLTISAKKDIFFREMLNSLSKEKYGKEVKNGRKEISHVLMDIPGYHDGDGGKGGWRWL